MVELHKHQKDAVKALSNGKDLYGSVGSGKTFTSLAYYMENEAPKDIYVITTARKRNDLDWETEAAAFGISTDIDHTLKGRGVIKIDSWNRIKEYTDIEGAFFIFDEQRLVGRGAWVKGFQKIAKKNNWILLSGTPGDTWMDYAPLFVANGYFKNLTEFKMKHVLYEPFNKYPKIRGYLAVHELERMRNDLLVEMPYAKHTNQIINWLDVEYDKDRFKRVQKDRWNIYEDKPIEDVAELFRLMRRVVAEDPSRLEAIRQLMSTHDRLIIFYNFNYELETLRTLRDEVDLYEWNGHKKDPVPKTDRWVYLVQYVAGAEAWNCITTNAMAFYSLTYSYKNFTQAKGRIDRLNTSYVDLYYYVLLSNSDIDLAIKRALSAKKTFNETNYLKEMEEKAEEDRIIQEISYCQPRADCGN